MFRNEQLEKHLATSSTLRINSAVIAEWNMNIATNIEKLGNYRYRPNDTNFPQYNFISQSYDLEDKENRFYTDATDADVVVDGGLDDDGTPLAFVSKKEKERLLYSLEDCFGRFRPRSGINKLRYFDNGYSHFSNIDMAERPRYYMATKDDHFKYWTSYRTEEGIERGIANINLNDQNFIDDAAPFVVYEKEVPANRIVVKMQTNVGTKNLGDFVRSDSVIRDPFFGAENQTTPVKWRVEYLDNQNSWVTAATFDENSLRPDGSPIIGPDGYVELFYGVLIPEEYRVGFNFQTVLANEILLPSPTNMPNGTAYLILENENESGLMYVVVNNQERSGGVYETFEPVYGWFVDEEDVASRTAFVKELVSPSFFIDSNTEQLVYREFQNLRGLRVVVETMNVFDSTFDLIELSPRLKVDLSDRVTQFNITKPASDLGITGLPVGQLLASIGSVQVFDFDQAFFEENENSIISRYNSQNIQFRFFEIVQDVDGFDFYIPIKTMYSEDFPSISGTDRSVSIELRDLYLYFESRNAPQVFLQNVSVSYAISLLLDYVGFSNYVFKRLPGEKEDTIPYFFVPPDLTVAEVLENIARSTQTAMFFDEFNNFILMSKNFMLPSENERETDTFLYGSKDFEKESELKNKRTKENISNILDISFRENKVYNSGSINYETRSIQRSYGTLRQASLIDREKTWTYKPVLLWEAEGEENVRSQNNEEEQQSAFALTAIPLNSNLLKTIPSVENHQVINNVIDFGDGVHWTARHNGFFFANGEIIRYDAIQYSIPGISELESNDPNVEGDNVWITSVAEYQSYFSKIPFNGKMYPTGLIRIYTEPHFEVVDGITRLKNGPVAKHGRGQFGTVPADHFAGLPSYWSNINRRRGCLMDFKYVFEERVLRGRLENVVLESNDQSGAVLGVTDASAVQLRNYVFKEFSSALDRDGVAGQEPEINLIPEGTIVTAINKTVFRIQTTQLTDNVATITTTVNHNFGEKDRVTIENATDPKYNGTYSISTITETSFTYSLLGSNRALSNSSGNVSKPQNTFKISKRILSVSDEEFSQIKRVSRIKVIDSTRIELENLEDLENIEVGLYVKNSNSEPTENILRPNTQIVSINSSNKRITLSKSLKTVDTEKTISVSIGKIKVGVVILAELAPETINGVAGRDNSVFRNSTVSGVIKNTLATQYVEESFQPSKYPATIQSSALVFKGNVTSTSEPPKNFISYIHRPLNDKFRHFGTRMRIIGKIENDEFRGQTADGSSTYFVDENVVVGRPPVISGGSGGLAIMVNPNTNNGYYFEIAALGENKDDNPIANIMFYKIQRNASATSNLQKAIPVKLFTGLGNIIVDDGTFVGQSRLSSEETTSVYDLAVEYEDVEGIRTFYLYINNVAVGIARDNDPLPIVNNAALFVRGNAKCMFENFYALAENYSQNTTFSLGTPVNSAFGEIDLNAQNSMIKYSLSGIVQSTYLAGLGTLEPPKYNILFEEFGTIMREAAYFNIRYDKAYPALYAKIAETFNRVKGFTVSGFFASAYGAEFLVFNHTDAVLNLDSTSGNYLRIQGVTFTQQSTNEFTVDEYFQNRTNFASPIKVGLNAVQPSIDEKKYYTDIKLNRLTEGTKEFSLDAPYIQSRDSANRMMEWLVKKIMKPRKSVGVSVFGMPHLQLGDLVEIDYQSLDKVNQIAKPGKRFVVYHIEYSRNISDISTNVFLSEVD